MYVFVQEQKLYFMALSVSCILELVATLEDAACSDITEKEDFLSVNE